MSVTNNTPSTPYTTRHLRRYRRYPKLYAELKHPAPFHRSHQTVQPFRLLNLPLELRMPVYAIVLKLPFPIALWPETNNPIASHQLTTANRNIQYLRAKMRQYSVNLGLLRVCKRIRHEAGYAMFLRRNWVAV
jgi:hypothetical protein